MWLFHAARMMRRSLPTIWRLPKALGHEASHAQAHVPEQDVKHLAEEITENIVHYMGFEIGL